MGLVKGVTHELNVPHEPGHSITVRELSLDQLSAAQRARMVTGLATTRDVITAVGQDAFKAIQDAYAGGQTAATADALDQAVEQYDAATLLRLAVVAWSYEDEPPTNPIAQLDVRTATWLVREIVRLHVPVGPAAEEARGNGSSPSTSALTA